MLRYFVIQHIDAIIMIVGGFFGWWAGYNAANKGDRSQRTKILKVLGPCTIAFGLLRFLMDSAYPVEWRRVATADRVASVEFPGAPELNDQTQILQGQTVHIVGWAYSVPGKDISLRISYSDVPASEMAVPAQERFNSTKQLYIGQGFQVIQEGSIDLGDSPGFHLHMRQGDDFVWLRVAYIGNRIYRAVGSAGAPFRDEPLLPKFIESFQIRQTTTNTTAKP